MDPMTSPTVGRRVPLGPTPPGPRLMDRPDNAAVVQKLKRSGYNDQEIESGLQEIEGRRRGYVPPLQDPGLSPNQIPAPDRMPAGPPPQAPPARGAGPTPPPFGPQRASDMAGPPDTGLPRVDPATGMPMSTGSSGPGGFDLSSFGDMASGLVPQPPQGSESLSDSPIVQRMMGAYNDLRGHEPQGRTPEQMFGPGTQEGPPPSPPVTPPIEPLPPSPAPGMAPPGGGLPISGAAGGPAGPGVGPAGPQIAGPPAMAATREAFNAPPPVGPYGEPLRPQAPQGQPAFPPAGGDGKTLGFGPDAWNTLMNFGLSTMAAGSQPGANFLGSVGKGGMNAMAHASATRAGRSKADVESRRASAAERTAKAAETRAEIAARESERDPVVSYQTSKGGTIVGLTKGGKTIATDVTVDSLSKGDMLDAAIKMAAVSNTDPTTLQTNKQIDPGRLAAALEFLGAYGGAGAGTEPAAGGAGGQEAQVISSQAEYAKLPSGASYRQPTDPPGTRRQKP